jgi:chromate transporter
MKAYLDHFLKFLRIGALAWGGPVAQISLLRDVFVQREQWVGEEQFRRTLALYQALPGPEAHEMCVYLGMERLGRWGGFLAGLGFMLPGFLLTVLAAMLYHAIGAAALLPWLVGLKPAVTALIARAAVRLGKHLMPTKTLMAIGLVSAFLSFVEIHFLSVLLACGLSHLWFRAVMQGQRFSWLLGIVVSGISLIALFYGIPTDIPPYPDSHLQPPETPVPLFLQGLAGGLFSFGGAYTAIPLLEQNMVGHYAGITPALFLDSVAIGNVLPSPLVMFAAFLGYTVDGISGALLITLGMFLPAFAFTLLGHGLMQRMVDAPRFHAFLEGISAGVAGMLAIMALKLMLATLTDTFSLLIFLAVTALLWRWRSLAAGPVSLVLAGTAGILWVILQ